VNKDAWLELCEEAEQERLAEVAKQDEEDKQDLLDELVDAGVRVEDRIQIMHQWEEERKQVREIEEEEIEHAKRTGNFIFQQPRG